MLLHRADMFEALRLTREGKLVEAMTVLRGNSPKQLKRIPRKKKNARPKVRPALPSSISCRLPIPPVRGATAPPKRSLPASPLSNITPCRLRPAGRRFKLYSPAGGHDRPLPLIVMLHGCTQSPEDFAAGTRMNELADEQMFFVAYPEQPKSANPGKCWNWFNEGDQGRDGGEPLLIAELTRQITRDHAVDRDRVYVAGLSAGGAAAAIMGATYPDLYAAVGIHSGLACGAARDMPSAFSAMRQGAPATHRLVRNERVVPTIVFHGDRDTTVSPVNGDQASEQASGGPGGRTRVSHGTTASGIAFTRTIRYDEQDRSVGEQWVPARARPRLVGGKCKRVLHRLEGSRCQRRVRALLPAASIVGLRPLRTLFMGLAGALRFPRIRDCGRARAGRSGNITPARARPTSARS